jgi:hypothetical protein
MTRSFDPLEEDKKKAQEKSRRLRERELGDIRHVLKDPEGRRFLWKVLGDAGVFRSSFTGNSETFYNEGKRSLGLAILKDIMDARPEAFLMMQREYVSEQKSAMQKQEE